MELSPKNDNGVIVLREMPGLPNTPANVRAIQAGLSGIVTAMVAVCAITFVVLGDSLLATVVITVPIALSAWQLIRTIRGWSHPGRRYRYTIDERGIQTQFMVPSQRSSGADETTTVFLPWSCLKSIQTEASGDLVIKFTMGRVARLVPAAFESNEQRERVRALLNDHRPLLPGDRS